MAKEKTDKVIRRVVLGKTYNIFSMKIENNVPVMELLEQEVECTTRPTEAEMCEKHKVDKVIIITVATNIGHYGVQIDKFMEIATLVKTEIKKEAEEIKKEAEAEAEAEIKKEAEAEAK